MFNLTKLALLWDWVNVLKKDSADVHGDLVALDSRVDALEVTAPKNYSTTETATGQKWIDGKDIYMITLTGRTGTTGTADIDLSYDKMIAFVGTVENTSGSVFEFNKYITVFGYVSKDKIGIQSTSNTGYQNTPYMLTVYYTKPTPGRAPEDPEETPEETKKTTKKKTSK